MQSNNDSGAAGGITTLAGMQFPPTEVVERLGQDKANEFLRDGWRLIACSMGEGDDRHTFVLGRLA